MCASTQGIISFLVRLFNSPLQLIDFAMSPPVHPFHPRELESKIKYLPNGKLRKPEQQQDLSDCALKELVQFDCKVKKSSKHAGGIVVCEPFARLFRRSVSAVIQCHDKSKDTDASFQTGARMASQLRRQLGRRRID
jgi:inner membrane protease subunit SOM1